VIRALPVLAALVAACALPACGGDDAVTVDWDLRESHTIDDVAWPEGRRDRSEAQLEPDGDVRVRLAGGTFSAAGGEIARVNLARRDDARDVRLILLTTTPRTTEEAAALAKRWAAAWDLPAEPVDAWARKAAQDPKATGFTGSRGRPAPGGVLPEVQLRYSFDEERPTVVGMQFLWPEPGSPLLDQG
jgi:hypothetical protein